MRRYQSFSCDLCRLQFSSSFETLEEHVLIEHGGATDREMLEELKALDDMTPNCPPLVRVRC